MSKYPKFKEGKECAYPEREDCNFCDEGGYERCPYMKYDNSKSILDPSRWGCTYAKEEVKTKQSKPSKRGKNG